jgi:hypothetical protein
MPKSLVSGVERVAMLDEKVGDEEKTRERQIG